MYYVCLRSRCDVFCMGLSRITGISPEVTQRGASGMDVAVPINRTGSSGTVANTRGSVAFLDP